MSALRMMDGVYDEPPLASRPVRLLLADDHRMLRDGLRRSMVESGLDVVGEASNGEEAVNEAESFVIDSPERERKTSELGELIMNRLRRYDKVAYVRFASVYLDFKDVQEFMAELKDLVKTKEAESRGKSASKN